MFDGWIETFTNLLQNPFFLILAVILAATLVFGLIKKLFKLAMIVLVAFVVYIGYLLWTGQDVRTSIDDVKKTMKETVSNSKENAQETKDAVEEKVEQTLWEKFIDFMTGDDD